MDTSDQALKAGGIVGPAGCCAGCCAAPGRQMKEWSASAIPGRAIAWERMRESDA